jgi:hypothetical protein
MPVVVNDGDIVEIKDGTYVKVFSLPNDSRSTYAANILTKKLELNKKKLNTTYLFSQCDIARVIDPDKVLPTYECTHIQRCVDCDWEGTKPVSLGVITLPGMQARALRCPWCGSHIKEKVSQK